MGNEIRRGLAKSSLNLTLDFLAASHSASFQGSHDYFGNPGSNIPPYEEAPSPSLVEVKDKDPLTQPRSAAPRALAREAPYLHIVSFEILLSRCESTFWHASCTSDSLRY